MFKKVFLLLLIAGAVVTGCSKDDNPISDLNSQNSQTETPKTKNPVKKIVYEAIQIQKEQNFYLNSATYLGFDGKTRISIPLRLPENTVGFYYTISTASGKTPVQGLNLLTQISSLLDPTGGVLSSIAGKLVNPEVKSPSRVDVYLLSKFDERNFINKDSFSYYADGTREAFSNGTIEVFQIGNIKLENLTPSYLTDYFYLGIRNPRAITGTSVSIEAVAIVKKEIVTYE